MGKCEVTWNEYEIWMFSLDIQRRKVNKVEADRRWTRTADAVTRPTKPYTDMTFGMGKDGFPAICMTQLAAKTYCKWLSAKDRPLLSPADRGRMGIRLPRRHDDRLLTSATIRPSSANTPGTSTTATTSTTRSARRSRIPGACTTCTATWPSGRSTSTCPTATSSSPARRSRIRWRLPTKLYPQAVRGGSWDDDPETLRSAARARLDQGLEAARPANSAEHLVFHRRAVPRFPRRASAGRAVGRREGQDLGSRRRQNSRVAQCIDRETVADHDDSSLADRATFIASIAQPCTDHPENPRMTEPQPTGAASRREFLKTSTRPSSAAALAGSSSIARSAHAAGDDTIKIALIGCGGRGTGAANQALQHHGQRQAGRHGRRLQGPARRQLQEPARRKAIDDRIDVPEERQFVGFDAYKKAHRLRRRPGDPGHAARLPPDPLRSGRQGRQARLHGKAGRHRRAGRAPVLAAAEEAKKKNLEVGVGLQRHHQANYIETIKRLQDGAIGDIVAARVYWNGAGAVGPSARKPRPDARWNTRCATGTTSPGSAATTSSSSTSTTWT